MKKIILSVDGMTCSACSNGLEKYLNKKEKIKSATVNLVMATVSIEYDDSITIDDLSNYISDAGFKCLGEVSLNQKAKNASIFPLIFYGMLALFLMYISMPHIFFLPAIKVFDSNIYPLNYSIILLILTLPFLFLGFDIIKSGIKNLFHKMPNMDTLVSIGVISSFLYSTFNVFLVIFDNIKYVDNLYFESTVFVIYFIKLGRFIDKNNKEKTKEAIKKLVSITPMVAKIKTKDGIKEITIDEVKKGDVLICLPGDKVAVDGEIVKGNSHFDESFITGESNPASKKSGNKVIAGSINYDGVIEYRAERIGKESTISQIVNLVVEATNTKSHISLLADKLSSYFVPIIIVISILTFIVCLLLGVTFNESLVRFITVLVVACPCSLGLATPLSIVISEGVCAKKGILVKSSEILELASKINTVVFDKTGTLTNGNLSISKIYNYSNLEDDELLSIVGGIEKNSTHPIGKGIINYINNNNIKTIDEFEIENIAGMGIKAVGTKIYYVGNSKLLEKLNMENIHKNDEMFLTKNKNSIVYVVEDNEIIGLIGVKDIIRNDAKQVIEKLKELKIDVVMLTGDNKETANSIGKELKIDNVISEVLPDGKAQVIKNLKKDNKKVMMIGDGINDAPSLTISDIGISLNSGTDIANDSADVILINNNLFGIVDLINISKKTLKIIKQNLFWAFLYNICMIPIAIGLFNKLTINPMIACISMISSSLLVTLNSLRLKKFI